MMRKDTCEKCLHHSEGLCRRYLPIVTSMFKGNLGDVTTQAWPKTSLGDWCGEFKKEKRLW